MSFGRLLLAAGLACSFSVQVGADVVFPARLTMNESKPGSYDVLFTLPILEGGRKLRAEPSLPPSCRDAKEHHVESTGGSYTESWRTLCDPASLAGEAVIIEGLLGTQTEILVEIRTLDGRFVSELLKPSRPGLVVPEPPSWTELAGDSVLSGIQRVLTYPELWVLALTALVIGVSRRAMFSAIVAFAAAYAAGQWAAARSGLLLSSHLAPMFVLLTALVPALAIVRGRDEVQGWLTPLWVAGGLVGVLSGGARPETVAIRALSRVEQVAASLLFAAGVVLGLLLLAATLVELREVLGARLSPERIRRAVGYAVAVASVGLLLYRASAFFFGTAEWSNVPLDLVLFSAVLGAGGGLFRKKKLGSFSGFVLLLAAGMTLGFGERVLPLQSFLLTGSLLFFGAALAFGKSFRWAAPLALVALLVEGFSAARFYSENLSLPLANAVGAALTAVVIFYAFLRSAEPPLSPLAARSFRFLGAGVVAAAVLLRSVEYYRFFDVQIPTDAALGLLRIPLAALVVGVVAILLWPRRRRVLSELGIETTTTSTHWALAGLAFLLVPVGNVAVRNPFFEPAAPVGDDARRVLSRVLWNTYHAFNLRDEDELYDTLSESVTGELVGDLYLDSRRRLTSGTREGAEVTVRDVSVVEVGDDVRGTSPTTGFTYPCKWVVVARVRHLQHVHHRQNIYNGNILVRVESDRWKIAGVELTSEDRVVLPWNPT